jgi:hypothetical protein
MLTAAIRASKGVLRHADLPVPRIPFLLAPGDFYSSADGKEVIVGWKERILWGLGFKARVERTLLHELLHALVALFPPAPAVRRVFGAAAAWRREPDYRIIPLLLRCSWGFATRWATTHPEEDLVETATFVLLGKDTSGVPPEKLGAVDAWFRSLRGGPKENGL